MRRFYPRSGRSRQGKAARPGCHEPAVGARNARESPASAASGGATRGNIRGVHRSSRRAILKVGVTLGLGWPLTPGAVLAQDDPASLRPREGDRLVRLAGSHEPLTPLDIPPGEMQTMAWAIDPGSGVVRSGSRLNQVLLLRFDPADLSPDTRARAADGVVAYTAICPHNGCDVDDWLARERQLSCACHSSIFDPRDGARVVDGPAPRALPALPLTVRDGKLTVAGPFTARVGFEPG
jgi:rieske iron-sulfur protein